MVSTITFTDLQEVYEVRDGLEMAAVRLAVARASDVDLGALTALVDSLERTWDQQAGYGESLGADLAFHSRLVALSGNSRLIASYDQMVVQTQLHAVNAADVNPRLRRPMKRTAHRNIINAMVAHSRRDPLEPSPTTIPTLVSGSSPATRLAQPGGAGQKSRRGAVFPSRSLGQVRLTRISRPQVLRHCGAAAAADAFSAFTRLTTVPWYGLTIEGSRASMSRATPRHLRKNADAAAEADGRLHVLRPVAAARRRRVERLARLARRTPRRPRRGPTSTPRPGPTALRALGRLAHRVVASGQALASGFEEPAPARPRSVLAGL